MKKTLALLVSLSAMAAAQCAGAARARWRRPSARLDRLSELVRQEAGRAGRRS